jgi:F0F1-type ATP synthase assembly protein I
MSDEMQDDNKSDAVKNGHGPLKDLVQAESMVQLAIAIPLGCAVGWLLGSWADRWLHQNWIGVVGIVLGAVGGFLQIYRVAAGYIKKDN